MASWARDWESYLLPECDSLCWRLQEEADHAGQGHAELSMTETRRVCFLGDEWPASGWEDLQGGGGRDG